MARITARTGVPITAILVAAAFNVAIAVWASTQPAGLSTLVSIVNVGALCAFIFLHASVIGYYYVRRPPEQRRVGRDLLVPSIGAAILLPILVLTSHQAQIVGAIWLIVGLIVVAVQERRRRRTRSLATRPL